MGGENIGYEMIGFANTKSEWKTSYIIVSKDLIHSYIDVVTIISRHKLLMQKHKTKEINDNHNWNDPLFERKIENATPSLPSRELLWSQTEYECKNHWNSQICKVVPFSESPHGLRIMNIFIDWVDTIIIEITPTTIIHTIPKRAICFLIYHVSVSLVLKHII